MYNYFHLWKPLSLPSPVKEKASLRADHLFLLVNQTGMQKGGTPVHPCCVTTFKRCKHIYRPGAAAHCCTSLTLTLEWYFSPLDEPFTCGMCHFILQVAALVLSMEELLEGKKAPGFGAWSEDQNSRNVSVLVLPLLYQQSHKNIRLVYAQRHHLSWDVTTRKARGEQKQDAEHFMLSALLLYLPRTDMEPVQPRRRKKPPVQSQELNTGWPKCTNIAPQPQMFRGADGIGKTARGRWQRWSYRKEALKQTRPPKQIVLWPLDW